MSSTFHLNPDEARALSAFGKRLLTWDSQMPVRLVSTPAGTAIGLYTAPPLNVLAFFAVPATVTGDPIDVTCSLASLGVHLESLVRNGAPISVGDVRPVRVNVTPEMSVAHLPPATGWQIPLQSQSGDVAVQVHAAVAEFNDRARGLPPLAQTEIANEIWGRPGWASLPMRVLHAAQKLGLLADDRSRVSAASCGSWKRLMTIRGQVFYNSPVGGQRIPLRIAR